jgi:hypothetical protein
VFFAALKICTVPANVNYRYLDQEAGLGARCGGRPGPGDYEALIRSTGRRGGSGG